MCIEYEYSYFAFYRFYSSDHFHMTRSRSMTIIPVWLESSSSAYDKLLYPITPSVCVRYYC